MDQLLFLKLQEETSCKQNILKDFFKVAQVVQQTVTKEENKNKQSNGKNIKLK